MVKSHHQQQKDNHHHPFQWTKMKMTMEDSSNNKQRPRLLQSLFPPKADALFPAQTKNPEPEPELPPEPKDTKVEFDTSSADTCSSYPLLTAVTDDEKTLLLLTNAVAWGLLLVALTLWQVKKRRALRRRSSKRGSSIQFNEASPFVDLEHETLIAALQEELHEKSVAENEQAILWRQEKRILQGRINELLRGQATSSSTSEEKKEDGQELHESHLLQQVKELQESVAFLTDLTENQTKQLEAKQKEVEKLHNILEEMQHLMGGATASVATTGKMSTTLSENTETEDENDSDEDSVSIDSSADDESVAPENVGKSRLPEGNKVVLLVSTMPGNLSTSVHQSRLESIFRQGLNLQSRCLEVIDGCDSELTCLRNDLFEISGQHAVYPQVFLVKDGDIQFVGDFDTVQSLHDSRELPDRIGLLLPGEEEEDEKENTGDTQSGNRYDHIGAVLLDTNTAGIAGREASKHIRASKEQSRMQAEPIPS